MERELSVTKAFERKEPVDTSLGRGSAHPVHGHAEESPAEPVTKPTGREMGEACAQDWNAFLETVGSFAEAHSVL